MKKTFLTMLSLVLVLGSLSAQANRIIDRDARNDRDARRDREERRQPPPVFQMCPTGRMGYAIEMNDREFQGRNNIIALKRELSYAYPRLNLRNMDLLNVCLMAKSQHGRGTAELIVGQGTQDRKNVDGTPQGFENSRDRTFEEVELRNFRRNETGVWQVQLTGRIKVRRVVVQLLENRRPPVRLKHLEYNAGKFDKFIYNTKSVRINQVGVEEISLIGKDKILDIKSVYVYFTNGTRRHLPSLEGRLSEGQTKSVRIDGRVVESLIIEATSADLFGGRAELLARVGYTD